MTSTPHHDLTADRPQVRGARAQRAAAIGLATVAALLIWVVAHLAAGIDLKAGSGSSPQTIGPAAVAGVSLVAGLAAALLAAQLSRTSDHPRRVWLVFTPVILVVSLAGPLGATTLGGGLTLAAMHLSVGAILIAGIGRTLRGGGEERR